MDPFTLALVGSTAINAVSSIAGGVAGKQQIGNEAKVADYNAALAQQQAQAAGNVGAANEAASRRQSAAVLGSAAALGGESNIGTGGSEADVLRQSEINQQMDALNIRYEGQLQRRNYNIEAQNYDYQARALRSGENGPLFAGILGAGTQLLGGVGDYTKARGITSWSQLNPFGK
jgi:hypothetical protein